MKDTDWTPINKWLDENEEKRKRFRKLTGPMVVYNELNPINKNR